MSKHPIPEDILIDHLGVLAKTGAGKTFLAKGIVENLLRQKRRVCIVDPKNAWWGLKSSADGKSPGFEIVVFGGPKADVPLLPTHGNVLGEAVATGHLSCIICTKGMPEGDRIRFLTDFLRTLDMKNSEPLHLVLDEAHMMAPQKPLGEMQRLTHWTSELVSGGRGGGFRVILLSQRPARLNKDVLTQCESLVAMRMTGPQDREAVKAWIHDQADTDKGKEIIASLPGLPTGEGWFWAPARGILKRVKFPAITTYDNSATQKDGKRDDKAKLAPVDLDQLQTKLEKVKAEIDAVDPAKLRAEVARLKKELAEKTTAAAAPKPVISKENFDKGVAAGRAENQKINTQVRKMVGQILNTSVDKLPGIVATIDRALELQAAAKLPTQISPPSPIYKGSVIDSAIPIHAHLSAKPDSRRGAEMRILRVLVSRHPAKFTMGQWAVLSKMKKTGGTWITYVSRLRTAGFIDETNGMISATESGIAAAGVEVGAPQSQADIVSQWKKSLGSGPAKIIDVLIAAYPDGLDRQTIAEQVNMEATGGTFSTYVSRLVSNLVVTSDKSTKTLKMSEDIMNA